MKMEWLRIESAPEDGTPILFANFSAMCLLTETPHVWSGRYERVSSDELMMLECSFAATNENGEPTHWMPLPPFPPSAEAFLPTLSHEEER